MWLLGHNFSLRKSPSAPVQPLIDKQIVEIYNIRHTIYFMQKEWEYCNIASVLRLWYKTSSEDFVLI